MQNSLLGSLFSKQLIQNSLFMQNSLIRHLFKKIGYSKQLIYAKTAYQDLCLKNNLISCFA